MIEFNFFKTVLEKIQEDSDNAARLSTIFRSMNNDFVDGAAFCNPDLTSLIIRLLDMSFGETCDWVSYWVYELDFGRNYTDDSIYDLDGEPVPLKTIENLYDLCYAEFVELRMNQILDE